MPDVNVVQIMGQIRKEIENDTVRKRPELEIGRFVSNYHSSILERIRNKNAIVLFGAGRYGKMIWNEFKKDRIKSVKCFCDNNMNNIGMTIQGQEVLQPKEAFQKYPDAIFVITVINFPVEITAQLIEIGVKPENIIFYNYARSGL